MLAAWVIIRLAHSMSAEVFAFETDVTAYQRGWPDYSVSNIPSAESVK